MKAPRRRHCRQAPSLCMGGGDGGRNQGAGGWREDKGFPPKRTKSKAIECTDTMEVSIPNTRLFMYVVMAVMQEIMFIILGCLNIVLTKYRVVVLGSSFLCFLFCVHSRIDRFLGNHWVCNFLRTSVWPGFGLLATRVERDVLQSALLHVVVAPKNTWSGGFVETCIFFRSSL